MKLRWHRRHERLDERVEQARAEADLSRTRLEETRQHVIIPLRKAGERNQFAALIRASLMEGHGGLGDSGPGDHPSP